LKKVLAAVDRVRVDRARWVAPEVGAPLVGRAEVDRAAGGARRWWIAPLVDRAE